MFPTINVTRYAREHARNFALKISGMVQSMLLVLTGLLVTTDCVKRGTNVMYSVLWY